MSDLPAAFQEAERYGRARRRRYTISCLPTTARSRRSAHEPSTRRAPPSCLGPFEWSRHRATESEGASRSVRHEIPHRSRVPSRGGKFQNIAEGTKDLVVLCRAGVEVLVCQFAQDQNAIAPPSDPHMSGQESILGGDTPSLQHRHGWRSSKSSVDGLGISDVKVGKSGTVHI